MNNFVKFLLDYYVWILVVLGIIIITIIGFLVDSKQKRKKKEQASNLNEVKTVEPLPEINDKEAVPVVDAKNQSAPTVIDNVIGGNGIYESPSSVQEQPQNTMQNLQQVQTSPNNVTQTPEINANQNVALSDQKPRFEPREVPMPPQYQMSNNEENIVATPQPVNAVSINQPIPQQPIMQQEPQPVLQQVNNQMAQQIPPTANNQQSVNTMAVPTNNQQMQQAPQVAPTNFTTMPNITGYNGYNNINNNQQPVNYQSIPNQMPNTNQQQFVSPIPNPTIQQQVATPVQNQQPINNLNQMPQQPTTTTPNIGINFVTDSSTAPNTDDDTWKL